MLIINKLNHMLNSQSIYQLFSRQVVNGFLESADRILREWTESHAK